MSRLWRYGSPYTRVRDYIQNKFIAEENRPIWFDVWTVHPPFREPVLKEKLPINDYFIRNRSIREPKDLNYLADKSRAAFRTSYTDSIISLDPDIAKVELPLSEKIARRVATLTPFAQEYKFDAYKAALVEAGIESDDFYRHEFLDNMADGELSTAEKTRLDRRKQQSEMELSMLQSMMESVSMQNYSIPDLDESISNERASQIKSEAEADDLEALLNDLLDGK
ncbi:unnamed protein product [Oikopleura dioica]|uniref:Small ribosomal subunit protein mS23 conserved domain-containing protein n=1 Tax=Oikopleura dioica TaxID=34765 RepID=E4XTH2_OIKDI|nr:unnamed protein product [Oikopleura dioica]